MPEWLTYVLMALIAVAAIACLVAYIVKVVKLPVEERKELIINFLCGLITTAEKAFEEGGKGAEKLKMVEEAFNKTAPWFLKILLASAGVGSLQELIEIALKRLKKTWDTDPKDPEEPKEEEEK